MRETSVSSTFIGRTRRPEPDETRVSVDVSSVRRLTAVAGAVLGMMFLIIGLGTTVGRSVSQLPLMAVDTWGMITTFTDFGVLAYAAAALFFTVALLTRRPRAVVVFLVATVVAASVHLSWIVPSFVPDHDRVAGSGELRVLTQNLLFGGGDAAEILAAAEQADVLALVEMTKASARTLEQLGITDRFPYAAGGDLPTGGAQGTRIYSRYPIVASAALNPTLSGNTWLARIAVPDLGEIALVAAHPRRPHRGGTTWAAEQASLVARTPRERTVIAGDLNAVDSPPGPRELRAAGFRDADGIVGAGWAPTFPQNTAGLPPLIGIDHVLVSSDLTATAFGTVINSRSDHRGVRATIRLRAPE